MIDRMVIIVPTKNRINWCMKKLKFYARTGYKIPIIFLDASAHSQEDAIRNCAKELNYNEVHYLHLPNKSIHLSIKDGLNYALGIWSYFVISGDDDFHLPKGLRKAIKFLDKDEDFAAVIGRAFVARMKFSSNRISILSTAIYWKPYANTKDSAVERFSLIMSNYINLEFAVKRVETGLLIANFVNEFTGSLSFQESGFAEYCTSTTVPMFGKIQNLNTLFIVRGDHSDRPFSRKHTYRRPQFDLDLVSGFENFSKYVLNFCAAHKIVSLDSFKSFLQKYEQGSNIKDSKKYGPLYTRIRRRILSIVIAFSYHRVFITISQV
jgi:glycosyltransferase domain-containing protein